MGKKRSRHVGVCFKTHQDKVGTDNAGRTEDSAEVRLDLGPEDPGQRETGLKKSFPDARNEGSILLVTTSKGDVAGQA